MIQIVSKTADTFQAAPRAEALRRPRSAAKIRPRKLEPAKLDAILTRAQTYLKQLEAIKENRIARLPMPARSPEPQANAWTGSTLSTDYAARRHRSGTPREEADRTSLAEAERGPTN